MSYKIEAFGYAYLVLWGVFTTALYCRHWPALELLPGRAKELVILTPWASKASRLAQFVSNSVGPEPKSDSLLVQMY